MTANWKKVGWRSLRHVGEPRIVVRFSHGVGRAKFLAGELAWVQSELSGGREPAASLARLLREAGEYWQQIGGGK